MPRVVFFAGLPEAIVRRILETAPPGWAVEVHPHSLPDEEKARLLRGADFLLLFPDALSGRALEGADRLRLVQVLSAGYDRVDLPALQARGIPLANNGGANAVEVAEHTLLLALALYRRLCRMDRDTREGRWRALSPALHTYTLAEKTVGIVGLGNIGRRVARLFGALEARLLYYDVRRPEPQVEEALGVAYRPLPDLLAEADIVTLHVPLTPDTRGLIGEAELARMRPSAVLINTSRGPVVDEDALVRALQEGRIAGAGLDVFAQEPPPPDHPLFRLENVVLTPHIGGVTWDTWPRRARFAWENFRRVWEGQEPWARVA